MAVANFDIIDIRTHIRACIPHRHQCHAWALHAMNESHREQQKKQQQQKSAMNVRFTGMKRIGWCGVCALCTRLSFTFPQCYCFMGRLFAVRWISSQPTRLWMSFCPLFFSPLMLATRWRAWDMRYAAFHFHGLLFIYFNFIMRKCNGDGAICDLARAKQAVTCGHRFVSE